MTTAHRPTWSTAVGGSEQGGNSMYVPSRQYSAKDLPGQQTMKERPPIDIDIKSEDYKSKLLQREEEYLAKKERRDVRSIGDKPAEEQSSLPNSLCPARLNILCRRARPCQETEEGRTWGQEYVSR